MAETFFSSFYYIYYFVRVGGTAFYTKNSFRAKKRKKMKMKRRVPIGPGSGRGGGVAPLQLTEGRGPQGGSREGGREGGR